MSKPIATEPATINFQTEVLKHLDKYCVIKDLNRSHVVQKAVKRFLAAEIAEHPAFWIKFYNDADESQNLEI